MSEQLGMKEGMRAVDERVESVLAENKATEAAQARAAAIELRATSKEVAALNDTAELEIFGSRGRTYTDPKTGDVIASAEKPRVGKIDSILTDYKYGATENERRHAAEIYQNRLEELLNNEGLELSQAKLVLDAEDPIDLQKRRGEAIGRRMAAGQSDEEARSQVDAQFAKISEQRITRIREGGVFTTDEYELVKKGKDLYGDLSSLTVDKDDNGGEQTTNSTDFTSLPVEKQRELLRTLFGKELVDQLSDADLAKYAVASDKIPGVEAAVAASSTKEEEKAASSQEGADPEAGSDTGTDADTDRKVDSDSEAKASDEVLKEVHLTPEERKRRDLLNLYRNASSDEMRRISEAAWGEKGMEGYDESMAYGVSDDEAVDIMQTAFDNGYRVAGQEADQDTEASDDAADAAEQQDSSDDETEQQDAPTGFLNRLRSRWDNMENRRRKVTRAIAGVALTAIGVTGAVVAYKLHMDHTAVLDAANNLKSIGIKPSEHANDPQAFANFVGSLKDLHVGAGQGVYDVLAHNGIDKSKVSYAELYDLQRQFPKELYLQQVGNVTDVRITNPGTLSQPLADALAKFASN